MPQKTEGAKQGRTFCFSNTIQLYVNRSVKQGKTFYPSIRSEVPCDCTDSRVRCSERCRVQGREEHFAFQTN
jgi:hypothetical protein